MLKVTNLDEFDAKVRAWFAAVEKAAEEAAVGLARHAFEEILETSPQYSGDFVANWKPTKNGQASFELGVFVEHGTKPLYKMGDSPAMSYARANAVWPRIKLGESIYLSNSATNDGENYAWKIEMGLIKLRPVNAGADHVVRRAAAATSMTYHNIGKAGLEALRKYGL